MVLDKIKNMLSHDEVVEKLQEKVQESLDKVEHLTVTVSKQQEEQEKLLEQVKDLHKDHKKLSKQLQESTEQIEVAHQKLGRAVSELLIFKPKLEKGLADKFESTLQSHLDQTTKDLSLDVKEHQKTQELATKTQEAQALLLKEVQKLQEITKNLNAKDFELSKHAKELHLKDQEKLRLMKRVDDLEKLLAKMKSRRN